MCKHLASYVQISTAYVNCDKLGWIEEKIYPMAGDPLKILAEIQSIPVSQIEKRTSELLGKYPNTYTFTKNLTEQILSREIGGIPFCILRPTIVGSSWKEPFPGWVDSVSAAGAGYLAIGLGILKIAMGKKNKITDQVPVDIVSNAVIVCGALFCRPQQPMVIHVGSSARNPVQWKTCNDVINAYWKKSPADKRIRSPGYIMTDSQVVYHTYRLFKRSLPALALTGLSKISATKKNVKNAQLYKKLINREVMISDIFVFFTFNEWIFASQNIEFLIKQLNPEERDRFEIDIASMDWRVYLTSYAYGLQKYVLKEEAGTSLDTHGLDINVESPNFNYFSDIKWAYTSGAPIKIRGLHEIKSILLNTTRVQNIIRGLAEQDKNPQQATKELTNRANAIISGMLCDLRMPMIRMFGWGLRKLWRAIYDKIVVDVNSLNKIKEIMANTQGSIVFVPTHRSYIDFLIVSYVFFAHNLKVPYIAASDDFLKIIFVNTVLRMTGGFFIRRKVSNDSLYQAILTEYIQQIIKDNNFLEFFLEGTRSRTGKILHPKLGMLSMCTDVFFDGAVPDVSFVPVTINYDRVLEGETFPLELLGEHKVKESLSRIIKAVSILNLNFGSIYVGIGDPVSVKNVCKDLMPNTQESKDLVNYRIGYELVFRLQENSAVVPTALVAAILLMHRIGVNENELITKVEWLRDEVKARGFRIGGLETGAANLAVRNALTHLKQTLSHKKDLFEPSISLHIDYKSILLLSYYRNTLHHIFAIEALIACACFSFGEKLAWGDGIAKARVLEETMFLSNLLEAEFVLREKISNAETINNALECMKKREILEENNGKLKIKRNGELAITLLCSLAWPLIDTYWSTLTFCSALRPEQSLKLDKLIQSVQWFSDSMYEERNMSYYESCSLQNIKTSVLAYEKLGVLEKVGSDKIYRLANVYSRDETKVHELLDHLEKFRKASLVKIANPHSDLKRALLIKFPEIPKL